MNRKAKLVIAGATVGLVSVLGLAVPANAATVYSGCTVTTPAPHKTGNTVTDAFVLTCNVKNTGDSAFLTLWRNNGNGTYSSWKNEVDASSANFKPYAVDETHTCTSTKSYVWHAEFTGDLQLGGGSTPSFVPVNSGDVTLACA
jgi:hypothetical protein